MIKDDMKLIYPFYLKLVFCACYHMYTYQTTNKHRKLCPPFFWVADSSAQPFCLSLCTIKFVLPALESLAGLLASDPASFVAMH